MALGPAEVAGWVTVAGAVAGGLGTLLGKWLAANERARKDARQMTAEERLAAAADRKEARADQTLAIRHLQDHIKRLDGLLDQHQAQLVRLHELNAECRENEARQAYRIAQLEELVVELRRRLGTEDADVPGAEPGRPEALGRRREYQQRSAEHTKKLLEEKARKLREGAPPAAGESGGGRESS